MGNYRLEINDDYLIKNAITYFEAYMFATTSKFIKEHYSFDEEICILNDNAIVIVPMNNLDDRKKALSTFNSYLKAKDIGFPSAKNLSVALFEFIDDDNEYDEYDLWCNYSEIKQVICEWAVENNRVLAIVQHFYQDGRIPHIHIIYNRLPRKHNELQDYLLSNN